MQKFLETKFIKKSLKKLFFCLNLIKTMTISFEIYLKIIVILFESFFSLLIYFFQVCKITLRFFVRF